LYQSYFIMQLGMCLLLAFSQELPIIIYHVANRNVSLVSIHQELPIII
jgi:hypothetical protein